MPAPSPSTDIRQSKIVRLRTSPSWLPEKYCNRLERVRIKVRPTSGERKLLRRRKPEPPSVWAPKNRVVTYGPLEGSRWDNDFMPHMRGIMDASFFPSVRYIGNCKAPQTGSSAGNETMMGYIADMCPGPIFVVYPDRDTTSKRSTDYLQPMFEKSPRLRKLLTGISDDMASLRIKLQVLLLYMGWAGSVTSLGNISAKYLFGDEVDKWPRQASKKEANTLKLFFERFRAFTYGGKCWLISTPSDEEGPIWQFLTEEAQVRFDYGVPCPECGVVHIMDFKYIDFGGERDPKKIEEQDLARYIFPCCGLLANDRVRIRALRKGQWYERLNTERYEKGEYGRELFTCLREMQPRKIAFQSPGWISTRVANSEMAAAFLRGLNDPAEMHYFDNQIAAKAHKPYRQARKEDVILKLKDDRPEGLVPGGGKVAGLIGSVDTQDSYFRFTIRAFGYGLTQESWLIRRGEQDTFAGLEEVMFDTSYQDVDGLYYPVLLVVIDTGGNRTSDVYDWCRKHPGRVLAYKGATGRKARPYSKTIIDRYPGTNVQIPGGLDLYICDSHHYKDQLAGKLRIKNDDPGAWHLHAETPEEFAREMCAEYMDERRMWQCPKGKANHDWDCSMMELVGADVLQLKYFRNENQEDNEDGQTDDQ
jgi:phage terminase large subunit GpA-like protein